MKKKVRTQSTRTLMTARRKSVATWIMAFLLGLHLVRADSPAAAPLSYASEKVVLHGYLRVRTFPGRPNFESIKEGDEPERQWVLELHHPLSVRPRPDDEYNYAVKNARLVTLAPLQAKLWPVLKQLENKSIVVSGKLECASSPHHHTDLVLTVAEVIRE